MGIHVETKEVNSGDIKFNYLLLEKEKEAQAVSKWREEEEEEQEEEEERHSAEVLTNEKLVSFTLHRHLCSVCGPQLFKWSQSMKHIFFTVFYCFICHWDSIENA